MTVTIALKTEHFWLEGNSRRPAELLVLFLVPAPDLPSSLLIAAGTQLLSLLLTLWCTHPKKMQQLLKSLYSQPNLFLTFWLSWRININIYICGTTYNWGYSERGRGTIWTSCALFHSTKRKTSLEDSCYFIHFTRNTTRLSRSLLLLSRKRIQRSAEMNTIGKNRVAYVSYPSLWY